MSCGTRTRITLRRAGRGLVVIVLPLVLLNNTRAPFVWISLVWAGACCVCLATARRRVVKAVWLHLALVCGLLAGAECWLASPDDGLVVTLESEAPYFISHPTLGYAPRPGARVVAREHDAGRPVYEVTYRIGADGLRVVPGLPASERVGAPPSPLGSLLFFGASFTFGEGLEDEQTMPHLVERGLRGAYVAHNFGFHGYGPQQMLASIESGLVESSVQAPPRYAIYQALPVHVGRVAGASTRDAQGPRYGLAEDGRLVRLEGPPRVLAKLNSKLEKSRLFEHCRALLHPSREDVDLWLAVVEESRRQIEERFPGCAFEVILWDEGANWITDRMRAGLVERRVRVHSIRDVLPGLARDHARYRLSEHDFHPSAVAQREIARYVREHVLDGAAEGPRRSGP